MKSILKTVFVLFVLFGKADAQDAGAPDVACGLDVMIALDTSCSIRQEDGEKVRQFIGSMVSSFNVGPDLDQTQFGQVNFNKGTQHQYYLSDSTSNAAATENVKNIDLSNLVTGENDGCRTHTFSALEEIRDEYFTPEKGDRPLVPNVVIVITDGVTIPRNKGAETIKVAKELADSGVDVFVIALVNQNDPDAGLDQLFEVASDVRNLFQVDDFDKLTTMFLNISAELCEVAAPSPPPTTTTPTPPTTTTTPPPTTTTTPPPTTTTTTTTLPTITGLSLCPNGFLEQGDRGSCQIFMSGCPKGDRRCCGCDLVFMNQADPKVPQYPAMVSLIQQKCLCEACLKLECIPSRLRQLWSQERRASGLPVS